MSYVNVGVEVFDSSNQKCHMVQLRDLLTGLVKTNDSSQHLLLENPKKNIIINNNTPLTRDDKDVEVLWMSKKDVTELSTETVYSVLSEEDIDEIQIPVFEGNGINATVSMVLYISKAILLDLDIVNGDNYLDTPLMGFTECLCLIKETSNTVEALTFKTNDIDRLMNALKLLVVDDNHHCITESNSINKSDFHLPIIQYLNTHIK